MVIFHLKCCIARTVKDLTALTTSFPVEILLIILQSISLPMKAWQKGLAVLGGFLGWEFGWWGVEQYRRKKNINEAQAYAISVGKPVLNVGCCGSPISTWGWIENAGDVNCDITCPVKCEGAGGCEFCNIFALPYEDKQFGSVICMHVLEHLDRPEDALKELQRVADRVYVITPLPIALQNWLYPEHKWVFWENANPEKATRIR